MLTALSALSPISKVAPHLGKTKKKLRATIDLFQLQPFTMAPGKTRTGRSLSDRLADLEDPTPKGIAEASLIFRADDHR